MNDEELFFDTSVLSNFARIERLSLLWKFSRKISTTREVLEEIRKGIPKRPQLNTIIEAQAEGEIAIASTTNEKTILFMDGLRSEGILGKGEISVMGMAKEAGAIFVTDDERATKKAQNSGVKILDIKEYRATITILRILLENGHIDKNEYAIIQRLLKENNFLF